MRAIHSTTTAPVATRTFEFVRARLLEKREIALLDVREEADHARSHPLFAANLPLSRIETDAWTLLPRRSVPVVVLDANGQPGGLAERALHLLATLGYSDVALLEGGSEGWGRAGGELFCDVNVPSKAFGELLESVRRTPSLPAQEVQALLAGGANVFVADARRFDEYATMSIPSGTSVPGAELALRIRDLAPYPQTLVVVNCAGRTRSLIGTQSLINAGIPNRVVALRNGTIGWTLAGLPLEHGQGRRFGGVSEANRQQAAEAAEHLARNAGVKTVTLETVLQWQAQNAAAEVVPDAAALAQRSSGVLAELNPTASDPVALDPADAGMRTTYCFDVRTPEEFAAGHIFGFRSVPGGQLVQETEMVAPVRGARIVLSDSDGVRARMTASWLAQMGWEVYVLREVPRHAFSETGEAPLLRPALPQCAFVSAVDLFRLTCGAEAEQGIVVLDLATQAQHRRGHISGARYILRSRFAEDLPAAVEKAARIVLTSPDGALAAYVAQEAEAFSGGRPVHVLAGGTAGWEAAGYALAQGLEQPASPALDRYRRPYEGTDNPRGAMAAYLEWEYGLVAQLGRDGTHGFHVI